MSLAYSVNQRDGNENQGAVSATRCRHRVWCNQSRYRFCVYITTTKLTFVDLEFDTTPARGAPLGDIASSLVCLHDLLRDLATLAAYPSSAEFREIQVVGIEMRSPLTIRLSLLAIPEEAVTAFQEICRELVRSRQRPSHQAEGLARIKTALDLVLHAEGKHGEITEKEAQRLYDHIATLQNAAVPLKRVVVKDE